MRRLIVLFIVMAFSYGFARAQSTFFRIYKSQEYNTMYSVSETTDHNFILCGFKETFQGSSFYNAQLLKIGGQGNILQERVLESDSIVSTFATIRNTISGDDPGFYLTGRKDSVSGDDVFHLLKLWKIDENLNFVNEFSLNFADSLVNFPQQFINLNDSIIYILSSYVRPPATRRDFSIVKFNLSDLAVCSYFPSVNAPRIFSNVVFDTINQQMKILISGPSLKEKGFLRNLTFDMNLNYISEFEPDFNFPSLIYRMVNYNNNSYIILGNNSKPSGEICLSNLIYNNNNELIDSISLYCSADTLTYPGSGTGILVSSCGIWSIGIYNFNPNTFWPQDPTWIQLSKLNNDFELTDQFYYGGDGTYIPYDIIPTSDGGMLITGDYYNPNSAPMVYQRDPFVLKLNSEGLIVNVDNHEEPIAQEALVLPNPGREFLQVKLAVQHKSAHFQLFDLGGRLVLETDLSRDIKQIGTAQLGSGAYIYRITASNRVIGSGKWVKE